MKKWILKAIVQKVTSYFPFSQQINYFFQKYVTKGVYLDDVYFYDRLKHAKEHIAAFKKYSALKNPTSALELGTGWYPVVPIALYLTGVTKIFLVDISFLTSKNRFKKTIEKFIEAEKNGILSEYLLYKPENLSVLKNALHDFDLYSLKKLFEKFNMIYIIEDARKLPLPDNLIDLITSNNTLEHIYPEILIQIMKEFKRIINEKYGVMSHSIDMTDHFAHFDKSISIYNFLKFSDKQWKWIDNSIQPQNRLRFDDYRQIFYDLKIPLTEGYFNGGDVNELATVQLDKKFLNKPKEVIAIKHCKIISSMKKSTVDDKSWIYN